MPYGRKTPLIDHVLHLTFVENPGIAFGIDFGGEFKLLISILTIIASFSLLIYFFFVSKENIGQRLSLALIIGGAFGNLIDRVFMEYSMVTLLYFKARWWISLMSVFSDSIFSTKRWAIIFLMLQMLLLHLGF
ncbi:MAG: signal peptidase II [Ignavibacteriales bacterium]|nr:signal peptidase II [Ignavibacteriales bacterium]